MRPGDPLEYPGGGRRWPADRSLPNPGVAIDSAVAPPPAPPEFDLIAAWAPFPVEFDGPWWLDTERATAEPDPELIFTWAPFPVEFDQSWWLDPERTDEEPERPSPATRQRSPPFGMIFSLGIHLLPLLLLLDWTGAPAETAGAIPVQLVLEEPPQASEKASPPTPVASEDLGDKPVQPAPAAAAPPPASVEPAPPRIAAIVPPPQPAPKPVPPREAHPSPPRPPAPPAPTPAAADPAVPPETPGRAAGRPEPVTTREEYLAQLVTLTRRHLDLLPTSLLAGRSGETVVAVNVLADGTIASLAIAHSSGYPDIDARVEQMVAAVRRFPPLPPWFQGPSWDLNFRLRFPFPELLAR